MKKFLRCDSGSSMVEFAVIVQAFIFLLIGLVETGRYGYYELLAAHAARAGVQYGAQNVVSAASASGMSSAALQDSPNGWTVTATHYCTANGAVAPCANGQPSSGSTYYVQVKVTGSINSIFHYPGLPGSLPLSSTAVMRVESQ